jgi:D-amino-acid dehydrogenase
VTTLVIGAGVIGTTLAYELARVGEKVTVVDAAAGPGLETSFANGSLITPSMSDPWASPGVPKMMLKYLGREDAPFLLRMRSLAAMAGWSLAFLRNCSEKRWRRNTCAVFPLAEYSRDRLDTMTRELVMDYDRFDGGTLRIHGDAASMKAAEASLAVYRDLGCEIGVLNRDECLAMEPSLRPVGKDIHGGFHFPDDRSGDCHIFTDQLANRAKALGVTFRFKCKVTGLKPENGRIEAALTSQGALQADRFVLSAGSNSPLLSRQLGFNIPVYPVKGYSATFDVTGWNQAPTMPFVDNSRKIGVVRLGSRVRIAGTAEFAGYDHRDNAVRSAVLLKHFRSLFPESKDLGNPQHWHGLRPMSPDGRPYIGGTPLSNLFINTGHGPLGWTLACGSARTLVQLMGNTRPDVDLKPFALGRP